MDIKETRQGAVTIMSPGGPLVEADVPVFTSRLEAVATRSLGRFVLDLSGVPYVDSAGLEALYDAAEQAGGSGVPLKVSGINETIREVMDLTEIDGMFEHFAEPSDAVRSFL